MEQQYKISGLEAFFMICLCLFFDAIDVVATFLDFLFGAGEIIKLINNSVAASIITIWSIIKGVNLFWPSASTISEFIPIVNALPIRTVLMVLNVYFDWHPKTAPALIKK